MPKAGKQPVPVIRWLAVACALLALAGCSQMQLRTCVRDMVRGNEPYQTQADREDSEVMARQICRQRIESQGKR